MQRSNRASDEFININQSHLIKRSSDEFINVNQSHLKRCSPGKKLENEDDQLPIYDNSYSDATKKEISPNKSMEKWIHVIPLILFFCAFTLWWFSHPVNVEIKDGRIFAINQIREKHPNSTQANQAAVSSVTQQEKLMPEKRIEEAELKHLASKAE